MNRRGKKRKAAKANPRLPHNKDTNVNVGFADAEAQDLNRLVALELPSRIITDPKFGRATVVREHAMQGIRQRLAELQSLEPAGAQ